MRLLFLGITIFWLAIFSYDACAFDVSQILHVPPTPQVGQDMEIVFKNQEVKRARILIATKDGFKIQDMEKTGDRFSTRVRFESLAIIKYEFQIETNDGQLFESEYFTIRQPSSADLEEELTKLKTEFNSLEGRRVQLQNTLESLKNTDPTALAKRKNQELARAYLALSKKERERDELAEKLKWNRK